MATTWSTGVLDLFVELAAIPSPSGEEEPVAEVVAKYLADLGVPTEDDDAGNLLARLEPAERNGGDSIFLCAHMDTVPPVGAIDPVVGEDGIVRNAAETILGADNKATVAVLLEAARLILSEGRRHSGVELLFTVREETGLQGAKAFDHTRLRSQLGFVFDCSGPVGGIVRSAPFGKTIDVVFKGRSAHAGLAPEEGRSAIAAAGRAIADLRLGRIDEETTSNVGLIEGGTGRNVVPDRCLLAAEARSRDPVKLADLVQEMLDAFTFAAAVAECEVETRISESYAGYRFKADDPVFALATEAVRRAGLEPHPIDVGGGADANVFNARGVPCVNLANGMMQVHTPAEHIAVADLETMLSVALELVDAARHA
ncbi:MAG TPA: M20/M25/M40 family metallo-hydrolase [Gaiellaceae bacterium]|jgi:tripeptide aminopeptidase